MTGEAVSHYRDPALSLLHDEPEFQKMYPADSETWL
jgi:hypothetical protein